LVSGLNILAKEFCVLKNFIVVIAAATSLNLVSATFSSARSEKKSQKSVEISGEDLSIEMLDPTKAQSSELQDKLQTLKAAADKCKAAMTGRAVILSKVDEPALTAEMQKNDANKTTPKEADKQSKQSTNIASFPADWEGRWAGPALIEQMVFSKEIQKSQPQAVASISGNMHSGRVGFCELVFEANADNAKLQQFPMVTFRIGPIEAPFVPGARVGDSSFIGTGPARNTMLSDGSIKNSEQLFYRLNPLKPGVIEQDSGERAITMRRTRQMSVDMRENVIYYALVGPDQMYIYIAQVDYLGNGSFKSKLLMHGVLKRKHDTA
jgi:hypothetical protein